MRGAVDEELIQQAIELFQSVTESPEGEEYLIVNLEQVDYGSYNRYFDHCAGETVDQLRVHLQNKIGERVAVGAYPPWLHDNDAVISAIVPDSDGMVVVGIY